MEVQLKLEGGATPRTWVLTPGERLLIGSGRGLVSLPGLAERHAVLTLEGEALEAVCLGAEGGTRLNGEPLPRRVPTEVRSGDLLEVGPHALRVTMVGGDRRRRARERRTASLGDPWLQDERFLIEGEIGRGAQGKVYAAVRRVDGRRVALKVLSEAVAPGSPAEERFLREARVATKLPSPFVVEVLDLLTDGGRLAIVMELVAGPSARDLLSRSPTGQVPLAHALRVGVDVGEALALAAQHGIVHRDVKPANVLLAPGGPAKLTDFGLAKDLQTTVRALTATGQGLGTLAYMPPEQVAWAKEADARADVYSLGASLYHLLAGRPPFEPTTPESVRDILTLTPPPLRSLRPDCPPPVTELLGHMLAKAPEERPAPWLVPRHLSELLAACCPGASFELLFGSEP